MVRSMTIWSFGWSGWLEWLTWLGVVVLAAGLLMAGTTRAAQAQTSESEPSGVTGSRSGAADAQPRFSNPHKSPNPQSQAGFAGARPIEPSRTGDEPFSLQALVDAMHPGWNLGNSLDATGSETSWGNPRTTRELIEQIKAAGFKSIRIPITWDHRMGGPPDYRIDETFMARVQEIVDWSLDAGLYVILNVHHDTGQWIIQMPRDRENVLTRFRAIWVQVAEHFKDYPHTLLFEGINEPRFSQDWNEDRPLYFELADELQTIFHQVVRSSGGLNSTRPLLLTTLTGSPSQARMNELLKTIEKLSDDRIIATVHYYGYYPFSVNVAGGYRFDNQARNDVVQTFDRVHTTFVARGIPVIVGEFGLLGFDRGLWTIERGEMLKYFEWVTHVAREKRLTLMLWDNGQHFDRRAHRWTIPELYETIMASVEGRASQAESDMLFVRAGAPIRDTEITIYLNGNELVDVLLDGAPLTRGVDYDLALSDLDSSSGRLVFKASLIEQILTGTPASAPAAPSVGPGTPSAASVTPPVAPAQLGVVATLACRFSHGPDWTIEVIVYDRPRLAAAEGSVFTFAIPTEFGGDRLAAMEAVYATGGNAGPANWTSFKEFGLAFVPEYEHRRIRLPREFFNEVRDEQVVLTFHFWSGEVVRYTLVKEGNWVTGGPVSPTSLP